MFQSFAPMTMIQQTIELVTMLLTGAGLAVLLDTYRAVRSLWRPGQLGTLLGDIAFSIAASLIVAAVLMITAWGEWRLYYLLFIFAGYIAYRLLTGYRIVVVLRRFLRWLFRLIEALVVKTAKFLAVVGRIIAFPAALVYYAITFLGRVASAIIIKPIEFIRKH